MMTFLFNLLISCAGALPLNLRRQFGTKLGYHLAPFLKEYRLSKLQLEKILKSETAADDSRKVFSNLGMNLMEDLNLKPILEKNLIDLHGSNLETFDRLKDSKRPIVALTAHTGNWDLLAAYVVKQGLPLINIGRPNRNKVLQDVLESLRNKYGIKTIWRDNLASTRELIKQAKSGGVISALIDQDTQVKSIVSNFFNMPCKTPSSIIELGVKIDAIFVAAFLFREANGRFTVYLKEIKSVSSNEILQEYHNFLEDLIKRYPAQWVWFHKRWRTPDGIKTMSKEEYINFLHKL